MATTAAAATAARTTATGALGEATATVTTTAATAPATASAATGSATTSAAAAAIADTTSNRVAVHDRNVIAAIAMQDDPKKWVEGFQQFLAERERQTATKGQLTEKQKNSNNARNQVTNLVQALEERLEISPKLKLFVEETEKFYKELGEYNIFPEDHNEGDIHSLIKKLKKISINNPPRGFLIPIRFKTLQDNKLIQDPTKIKLLKLLFAAIDKLDYESVEELLNLGIETNVTGVFFSVAIESGNGSWITEPITSTPLLYSLLRIKDKLIYTKSISHLDCCKVSFIITDLIKADCPLDAYSADSKTNIFSESGNSFLHLLSELSVNQDNFHPVLDYVLSKKPNVNSIGRFGKTPLMSSITCFNATSKIGINHFINLYKTVALLIKAGGHDYFSPLFDMTMVVPDTHPIKCYNVIHNHSKQWLNSLSNAKTEFSDMAKEYINETDRLIYIDMAGQCLKEIFNEVTNWGCFDLQTILKEKYGMPDSFPESKTVHDKRLMSQIAHDKEAYSRVYPSENVKFSNSIVCATIDLIHANYNYSFELSKFAFPIELISLIQQYYSPNYFIINKLLEAANKYYIHAGKSKLTNSPDSLRTLIAASEITPHPFTTIIKQIEETATGYPLIPTPKSDEELTKLDAELLKEYPNARLFRDPIAEKGFIGEFTPELNGKEKTKAATSLVSPVSITGWATTALTALKSCFTATTTETNGLTRPVFFQYRYVVKDNDNTHSIRKRFMVVRPSVSVPDKFTVITHAIDSPYPADNSIFFNPNSYLFLRYKRYESALKDKLALGTHNRLKS